MVKAGEKLEEAGDLEGALAKYQEAMTGFRNEGVKRPKLKEKMDAGRAKQKRRRGPSAIGTHNLP